MYSLYAVLKISEWYDGVVNEEPSQIYVATLTQCSAIRGLSSLVINSSEICWLRRVVIAVL